jgi:hypothetical protein
VTASEVTHATVRERFGLPTEQIGSVNDPRTHEEHGVHWNEKWIYPLEDGGRRIVYWYRYDFRGALREEPDGAVRKEAL